MRRKRTTRPALRKLTAKWQRRLRLQDWNIDVAYAAADDFPEPFVGALGVCSPDQTYKRASILILDPKKSSQHVDVEPINVHELLHLHFHGLYELATDKDRAREYIEHAITAIVQALISAK